MAESVGTGFLNYRGKIIRNYETPVIPHLMRDPLYYLRIAGQARNDSSKPETRNPKLLLSTAYLAPVEYYLQMCKHPQVIIEAHCNYIKQTYRNRCVIATATGCQTLSIPIVKPDSLKCPTKDIRIAEHGNWRHLHWNAIVSAYNSTPFFEYYADDFRPFYEKSAGFLFDFNEKLRELICSLLDISPAVSYSTEYVFSSQPDVLDLREAIHPKKSPLSLWREDRGEVQKFRHYYQVFEAKHGFQSNLSIVDLLFNMGPEAALWLG